MEVWPFGFSSLIATCYGQIGIVQACGGFFNYFTVMTLYGFYPWDLVGLRHLWDQRDKNDVIDSFGQEWVQFKLIFFCNLIKTSRLLANVFYLQSYLARKRLEWTSQTSFFVAIVIVQWADLIICKTRRNSILDQKMTYVCICTLTRGPVSFHRFIE